MDSRTIDYLIHNLSKGTQCICSGRKELLSYFKLKNCNINKNKISRIHCLQLPEDGEMILESNTTHMIYCVEELYKWEK
jgi:hypothetical protein